MPHFIHSAFKFRQNHCDEFINFITCSNFSWRSSTGCLWPYRNRAQKQEDSRESWCFMNCVKFPSYIPNLTTVRRAGFQASAEEVARFQRPSLIWASWCQEGNPVTKNSFALTFRMDRRLRLWWLNPKGWLSTLLDRPCRPYPWLILDNRPADDDDCINLYSAGWDHTEYRPYRGVSPRWISGIWD